MEEEIIPIPDHPTNEELVDAIQQLQRIVEIQQVVITTILENS